MGLLFRTEKHDDFIANRRVLFCDKDSTCYTFQCDERFASLTIRSDCSFSGRMFRNHVCLYMIHLQLKAKGEAQTQTKCIHSFQLLMNQQKKTYVFSD